MQGPNHMPSPITQIVRIRPLRSFPRVGGSTDRHRPPFSYTEFLVTISVMRMHIRLTSDPPAPLEISAVAFKCPASQHLNRSCTQKSLAERNL